jgi:dTDP-4-dehydrorhamnose reductase
MLGHMVFRWFARLGRYEIVGTLRASAVPDGLMCDGSACARLLTGVDVLLPHQLETVHRQVMPDVVVNCVGLVKQLDACADPVQAIPINSLLPHHLAALCRETGARLIHISTDCVFSGRRGQYTEADLPDADDLYGRSKLLGEIATPGVLTLRTSVIGPEIGSRRGLLEWFLGQQGAVRGFDRAFFSGLPSVELARVISDFVLPRPALWGVYHLAADPIDKCSLLKLIAAEYGLNTSINPDHSIVVDRSLDASRFNAATGYVPPGWPELIRRMHTFLSP